jgi:hypothetical protein
MAKRANRLPPPLSQASLGYANVTLQRRVHKFNIQASVLHVESRSLPLAVLIRIHNRNPDYLLGFAGG